MNWKSFLHAWWVWLNNISSQCLGIMDIYKTTPNVKNNYGIQNVDILELIPVNLHFWWNFFLLPSFHVPFYTWYRKNAQLWTFINVTLVNKCKATRASLKSVITATTCNSIDCEWAIWLTSFPMQRMSSYPDI